jgi:hypothetical protein
MRSLGISIAVVTMSSDGNQKGTLAAGRKKEVG